MSVVSYSKDGILTVCLTDARLTDEAKLEQLGAELIKQLNDTTEERVILDFRNVQFMSSSMLGKLVQRRRKDGVNAVVDGALVVHQLIGIAVTEQIKDKAACDSQT